MTTISREEIYSAYYPKVLGYVRGKVNNSHDAEELTSTVFLKVMQKLDSFDAERAALSTWIYTIARNTVTDFFRSRRTLVMLEDYMVEESAPEVDDDTLDQLADALLTLNEKERDLIVLHYFEGHTLKVVAEMMGMSYINAKVIHRKALDGLKGFYKEPQQ